MRDRLAVMAASACGVLLVVQYFVNADWLQASYRLLLSWMQAIFAFALVVGVLAVIRDRIARAGRTTEERVNAVVMVGAALVISLLGFVGGTGRESPFQWAFVHLQAPMQTTVFSLLAFYVATAAYRGFRARTIESGVLVVAALIVLLGRVPIGEWLTPVLPGGADWILNTPALAAKRAILIGIGLGMAATSLRVIAGIERTYLGGR